MSSRRGVRAVAAALAVVALSACSLSAVVAGSEVTVAVNAPMTSLNPSSSFGRASVTNSDVAHLTGSSFAFLGPGSEVVIDESFGSAEVIARDPLTVRYTVAEGVRWSDGVPVDASDLLLAWAANSGALNDPELDEGDHVDPATGRYDDSFPDDVVHFDGLLAGGIEQAVQIPQRGDRRTLFVHFERFVPDWLTVLAPGVAAHALARSAWGLSDELSAEEAKEAVVTAITERDEVALAALSRAWSQGLDLVAEPDPTLLVASGPYLVEGTDEAGGVVLAPNPEYTGMRRPVFEKIRLRVSSEPLETIGLLRAREVDVATFAPSEDVVAALGALDGVTVATGIEARFEHLDLQFDDARHPTFRDPRLREAFLLSVPRELIVEELVRPLSADAAVLDSFVVRESSAGYSDVVAENGSADYRQLELAQAQRLIAEAGATAPPVCILYDPGNLRRQATYRLIAESAGEAGFVVSDCSRSNWESMLGVAGAYDAALFSWDTSRLGPEAVAAVFRSDSRVVNLNRYANAEVDELIDELSELEDEVERTEILARIDALVWADAYGLPLYSFPTITAVRDTVEGVERSPLARGVFWNAWDWRPAD